MDASRLRPHQRPLVAHLLEVFQRGNAGIDLSVTGAGKSYVASAVANALGVGTLVLAPKIARCTWERAAAHFDDRFSFVGYEKLRAGNTPYGRWDNPDPRPVITYKCQTCLCNIDLDNVRPCPYHPRGIHCVETHKKRARYGKFHFHPAIKFLIVDEAHRCGGMDSLNADMLIAAKRQGIKTLMLTATAACGPLNMRAIGYVLGLHNLRSDLLAPAFPVGHRIVLPSFYRWAGHYNCRYVAGAGWKWLLGRDKQQAIMAQIRACIIPAMGVRVSEEDIPGFPKRQILAELYDLDDPEAVDSCYKKMAASIEALRLHALNDVAPDHPLTVTLREHQKIELLKVPVAEELAKDYLAKGFSVVFFVNYAQTITELAKRFPKAGIIDGSPERVAGRDAVVETFQSNDLDTLIVNSKAGGACLSLHDLDGQHPRVGLVFPCFSANTMRQLFGRLQRDGGQSQCFYRVLFANKTVEVRMHRAVQPKLNNLDTLNDGDLCPDNLPLGRYSV